MGERLAIFAEGGCWNRDALNLVDVSEDRKSLGRAVEESDVSWIAAHEEGYFLV